ncbi:UbiA family prenyltransferase [Halococcus salifodinae]|uniref:UbiA family prenyltransferase n=1 Tax=Halococcus salifodinae TaxID=36738 RepID=UPI001F4D1833|nr:UbiA family prenyltransferase [Halococcus salifodinae]
MFTDSIISGFNECLAMASHHGTPTATSTSSSTPSVQLFRDFVTINRLPETIGYNLAYLGVGVGLATTSRGLTSLGSNWDLLLVGFLAAMLSKMQASVADVIHDRDLDRENPEKSRIPDALDRLSIKGSMTILAAELIGGMSLWGWISVSMHAPVYLGFGAATCLLGFVYTYPPRIKERGLFNHLTTTAVDVGYVAVFFFIAGGSIVGGQEIAVLAVVFLYAFGYHVAHQAADTYYDRIYGISTFTQMLGVRRSVLFAGVSTALAALINIYYGLFLAGGMLLLFTLCYSYIALRIRNTEPKVQSDRVSRWFSIGLWATVMNSSMVLDLALL